MQDWIAISPERGFSLYCRNKELYAIIIALSYRYPATGGGDPMETFISFLVAVAGGVACHYIIKWLDGDRKDNK